MAENKLPFAEGASYMGHLCLVVLTISFGKLE